MRLRQTVTGLWVAELEIPEECRHRGALNLPEQTPAELDPHRDPVFGRFEMMMTLPPVRLTQERYGALFFGDPRPESRFDSTLAEIQSLPETP